MDVESSLHLSIGYEQLLSSGLYSDITFQTGDDLTPAHRCILASFSPVFNTMLSAGFQEQETAVIRITDMTTPELRAFLSFLYTGHLEQQKVADFGLAVFAACHKYCLPLPLRDACISGLCRSITRDNCLSILEVADLYNEERLVSKCRSFVDCLFPTQEFREIKLWFRRYNTQKARLLQLVVPTRSTVAELVAEVNRQLKRPNKRKMSLRVLQVCNHRIGRIFRKKDPLSIITQEASDHESLRAEEAPLDEDKSVADKYVLHVHHFRMAFLSYEAFGEPFAMNVHHQETLGRIKQRIKARLGVSQETLDKWKFARFRRLPGPNEYFSLLYLDDNMPMSMLLVVDGCSSSRAVAAMALGIHHT